MATATRRRSRASVISVLLVIWLLIGLAAAVQRGYLSSNDNETSCAEVGTTLVTIIAGPLNYLGANPKIDCDAPEPSR
jgi:hypothetical protein